MIEVLGIGPGNLDYLTLKNRDKIKKADIIIAGKRHLKELSLSSYVEKFEITSDLSKLLNKIKENLEKNIVILASGDPSLYGIGNFIKKNFDENIINIEPGISSVQYFFAKLGINMNNLFITSGHGRELDFDFLFMHEKIAILTDKKNNPIKIFKEAQKNSQNYNMWIGENLSYSNEKIIKITDKELFINRKEFDMNVVVLVKKGCEI